MEEDYKTNETRQIIHKEVVNSIITLLKEYPASVNIEILKIVEGKIMESSFLK